MHFDSVLLLHVDRDAFLTAFEGQILKTGSEGGKRD